MPGMTLKQNMNQKTVRLTRVTGYRRQAITDGMSKLFLPDRVDG
jgi:hypothetical protein